MIDPPRRIALTREITRLIRICQDAEKSVAGVADEPRGENQVDVVETADLDRRVDRRRRQRRGTSRRRIR